MEAKYDLLREAREVILEEKEKARENGDEFADIDIEMKIMTSDIVATKPSGGTTRITGG